MGLSRRHFLHTAAVSVAFSGLSRALHAQRNTAPAPPQPQPYLDEIEGYGPLVPDPQRILDLPKGFSYRLLSHTGNPMDDGLVVPGAPDGMEAFPGPNGRVILVRNHELGADTPNTGAFGWTYEFLSKIDQSKLYDAGKGQPLLGGTTTIVYDPATGRVERQFMSLAGTMRNCAGGRTPWNSWITCEENIDVVGDGFEKDHGYAFEVQATATGGLQQPVPLKAMGRFFREAVAVDPRTSIVYQTEDRPDSLLYRFIPARPGNLASGRLQALALRDRRAADTRNWAETGAPRLNVGEWATTRWIDVPDPDTKRDDLRTRGADLGAALFARGEGAYFGQNELYVACTTGGLGQRGQVFRYVPSAMEGTSGEERAPGRLQLFLEPNNAQVLESVDNVAVAPWGGLFLCEDNAAPAPTAVRQVAQNYVRGVTPDGKVYAFARNRYAVGASELAGVCFAPNHPTMFLNIQVPGFTLAIAGPWDSLKR